MKKILLSVLVILGMAFSQQSALAGEKTEALRACLLKSATAQDDRALVRWVFAIFSQNQALSDLYNISPEKKIEINKEAGATFTRLITVDCRSQFKQAAKSEGSDTFGEAFKSLGERAFVGFADEKMMQMAGMELIKYIDLNAIAKIGYE